MDNVTLIGKETTKLYEEYKTIEEKLKQKKEQLFPLAPKLHLGAYM